MTTTTTTAKAVTTKAGTKVTPERKAELAAEKQAAQALLRPAVSAGRAAVKAVNTANDKLDALFTTLDALKADPKHVRALGHNGWEAFIGWFVQTHLSGLRGDAEKSVARYVSASIPGISARKVEDLTGISKSMVNRATNGSTAGDGQQGHGGSRQKKSVADAYATAADKVTSEVMAKIDPETRAIELRRIAADSLRLLIDSRAELLKMGLDVPSWDSLAPAPVHSGVQGTVGGSTEAGRKAAAA